MGGGRTGGGRTGGGGGLFYVLFSPWTRIRMTSILSAYALVAADSSPASTSPGDGDSFRADAGFPPHSGSFLHEGNLLSPFPFASPHAAHYLHKSPKEKSQLYASKMIGTHVCGDGGLFRLGGWGMVFPWPGRGESL